MLPISVRFSLLICYIHRARLADLSFVRVAHRLVQFSALLMRGSKCTVCLIGQLWHCIRKIDIGTLVTVGPSSRHLVRIKIFLSHATATCRADCRTCSSRAAIPPFVVIRTLTVRHFSSRLAKTVAQTFYSKANGVRTPDDHFYGVSTRQPLKTPKSLRVVGCAGIL